MDDVINRKDAIGAILSVEPIAELSDGDAVIRVSAANYVLGNLPSAQSDSCNGCKWEYAFGYGECHHCKRRYDDMYEVKDDE